MIRFAAFALTLTISANAALADLTARFVEGAPKDRIELRNDGACPLPAIRVTLDLGTAPAGLMFDTSPGGAGRNVAQPFEIVEGADAITAAPQVRDGDRALRLSLRGLEPGARLTFTVDVDDSGPGAQTIVEPPEMAGTALRAELGGRTIESRFDTGAEARIGLSTCLS